MLVSFSVANFRSFGDEATLTMVASNKLTEHEHHRVQIGSTDKALVRAAVIYGANAAGKSNLVKAIDFAQRLIREPNQRRSLTPFRFSEASEQKPSSFEFQFLIKDRVFNYGFDVLGNKVVEEWLSVKKGDDDVILFEREQSGAISVPESARRQFQDDEQTLYTLDVISKLPLREEQLFLNRALSLPEQAQGPTLSAITRWFSTTLVVLTNTSRPSDLFERLHRDKTFRAFCSSFLKNVGTGVGGLEFSLKERESSEWERAYLNQLGKLGTPRFNPFGDSDSDLIPRPDKPGYVVERKLLSEHRIKSDSYHLPFSEESDGTQSLLHLMPILAPIPDQPLVAVIDELDRSLHPLICWEFVRFFSDSCPGAPRQLIATTHEAHLLNLELLRRDEYWFAEKDETQQTRLSSLDEYSIRNDLKVEKGYLNGRFGAIPVIGGQQSLEDLLNCGRREH